MGIFDQSSFAKYRAVGRDVVKALSWLCANDIEKPVGTVIYTQMLNDRGGIECDLTVTRIAQNDYYLVTGTGFATHDLDWIRRNIPDDCDMQIDEVTPAWGVLSLMGPDSRHVLQKITSTDLSDTAFPFANMQIIYVNGAAVRAVRISYAGELGWELHLPVESMCTVYEALMSAGADYGIANAGYRAIESLRLEKGYLAWGADIGPDHTPLEAGLSWAAKLKTDTAFIGREALLEQQKKPLKKRFASFSVSDENVVLLGRETIYRNGERVGWLSSAGWGYTLNCNIGMGYVRRDSGVDTQFIADRNYELEVAGERVACKLLS